ncbi:MAG: type IVB secretion system protein IcmH/DotU, partial [Deltaproteobacteria bacterium]|nr:type IVB secretion system protein IcmH/DotU [Deltaproteobacteria bacterium]
EIQSFSNQAQALGVRNDTLTAARYLLCTALDESVTSSPIPGAASDWAERSLLSTFHNETHGGEVFFQVLDRVMQQPAANLYLLELIFLLLSFGFEGKYRLQDRGPLAIEAMRDSLYRQIRLLRGEPGQDLSRKIEPASFKNKTYAYVPLWLVATVVAVCLSVTFWGFSFALGRKAEPLLAQFSSHAPSATPLAGPASVPASTTTAPDGDSPAHSETLP